MVSVCVGLCSNRSFVWFLLVYLFVFIVFNARSASTLCFVKFTHSQTLNMSSYEVFLPPKKLYWVSMAFSKQIKSMKNVQVTTLSRPPCGEQRRRDAVYLNNTSILARDANGAEAGSVLCFLELKMMPRGFLPPASSVMTVVGSGSCQGARNVVLGIDTCCRHSRDFAISLRCWRIVNLN